MNEKILRQKITQSVIENAADYHSGIGGAFVGGEIIKTTTQGAGYTLKLTEDLQKNADSPLLIPADLEAGAGCAVAELTKLPNLMGIGAANDLKIAYDYGYVTGKEARSVGINWAFSPVIDLNINRFNPVTNARSIGDDPAKAIPLLKEVVRGMQDAGIAACIKHFPGDGVDYRDQHIVTTCNSLSYEGYMKNHGRVFAELAKTAYTVMVGHICLPCFQKEKIEGHFPPATLSNELMVEMLRKEMGFKGLIVSDALPMGGFRGWHNSATQSEVISYKNGCDMMLWPTKNFVDSVVDAVQNGFITEDRVNEAYERVQELKDKLGLSSKKYSVPLTDADKSLSRKTATAAYQQSLVLECDTNGQIPFEKTVKKVAIVPVGKTNAEQECTLHAQKLFAEYSVDAQIYPDFCDQDFGKIMNENDKVFYMLFSQPHKPRGPLDFYDNDTMAMWISLTMAKEKTVAAAFGSPYFKSQYFERANTFINAYTPDVFAVEAVVRAIMGEFKMEGTTPVKL